MYTTTNLFTINATIRHAQTQLGDEIRAFIILEGSRSFNYCHVGVSFNMQKSTDAAQLKYFKELAKVNWLADLKNFKLRAIVRWSANRELELLAIGYRAIDLFYVLDGPGTTTNEEGALKMIEQSITMREGLQQ
ncbi:MAG: hypothetical protein HFJ49_03845 [Clostridia bacterium]|nr:hypothetical protein [Clostridia bacterium]